MEDVNNSRNHKYYISRFRGTLDYYAYKYWWLYLLIFFLLVFTWYYSCWPIAYCGNCEDNNTELLQRLDRLYAKVDSCCNQPIASNQQLPVNENFGTILPCDDNQEVQSGEKGVYQFTHDLGSQPGVVELVYKTFSVPDQIDIFYNGKLVATTNTLVSGEGTLRFNYIPNGSNNTYCTVKVTAPFDGTEWIYHLGCPR